MGKSFYPKSVALTFADHLVPPYVAPPDRKALLTDRDSRLLTQRSLTLSQGGRRPGLRGSSRSISGAEVFAGEPMARMPESFWACCPTTSRNQWILETLGLKGLKEVA